MFHNSRKTIGVFLERSASEFQNRLCQGIITGAKELGYNVAVFSNYGNYGQILSEIRHCGNCRLTKS